jgi:hypothetical protein
MIRDLGPAAEGAASALPMREPRAARIRCLPHGEFRDAAQLEAEGQVLRLDVPGPGLAPGTLLEIEAGSMLYLGEVERQSGSVHSVVVEHFVDRAVLDVIRDMWS